MLSNNNREYYRRYRTVLIYQIARRDAEQSHGPVEARLPAGLAGSHKSTATDSDRESARVSGKSSPTSTPRSSKPSIFTSLTNSLRGSSNLFKTNAIAWTAAQDNDLGIPLVKTAAEYEAETLDRLMQDARIAVIEGGQKPNDKHIHVLLKTNALCRYMAGVVGNMCKSGKDRTSMGVTLDETAHLVKSAGAVDGKEVCQTLRTYGARRMNVYANTGQCMYAFGPLDRLALPSCYTPPLQTCSGNVNT